MRFATLVTTFALLSGCTIEAARDPSASGSLSLALSHTDAAGARFRLSQAVLRIEGPEQHTLQASADESTLEVELPPGQYTLALEAGYVLEREEDGVWSAVAATLTSENPLPFSVVSSEVTSVNLRFVLDEGSPVELMPDGTLAVGLVVEEAEAPACDGTLVVSELDYDQTGSDAAELVEIYNPTACAVPLAGTSLVLYNGGSGAPVSYASIALDGAGSELAAGSYLVVGAGPVLTALPSGVLGVALSGSIQNGDPDGLAIERDGVILDSLSYGGELVGITEGTSAPSDSGDGSIGRCSGLDTNDNSADFTVFDAPTPGVANPC